MAKYDFLIVGSGLFGATFAYFAAQSGKRCLVIEKRLHTGGNIYCENIEGINVHKYGAHIFHTSNSEVWNFVNSLVPFNRYTNSPLAIHDGKIYNLPFNMNTFHQLWGVSTPNQAIEIIERQRADIKNLLDGREPANLEEQALCLVGRDIFEKLIKGYTEKQWGRKCSELPAFIIRRLPLRFVYDNNYFNDKYQGIPIGGYNPLIDKLLQNCEVRVNADFFADRKYYESLADKIIYTGPLDEFFGYKYGKLDWRSVSFKNVIKDQPNWQGNAVVNYTNVEIPYTRIIEHKHFECFGDEVYANPHTVLSYEHSAEWSDGADPYYPVNDSRNEHLASIYRELSQQNANVYFGGHLAQYRYFDMAPVIKQAMALSKDLL